MLIQIKYLINYYTVSNNAIFYRLKYKSTLNLEIIIRRICNRKEWLICEVRVKKKIKMDTYHPWKGRIATSSSHQAPQTVARYRRYISKTVSSAVISTPFTDIHPGRKTAGSTDVRNEACLSTNGVTRNSKADPERCPVNRSSSYAIPFLASQQGSAQVSSARSIHRTPRWIFTKRSRQQSNRICIEHRFYCVSRRGRRGSRCKQEIFFLLSQLPLIPSIRCLLQIGPNWARRGEKFFSRSCSFVFSRSSADPRGLSDEMERNECFEV